MAPDDKQLPPFDGLPLELRMAKLEWELTAVRRELVEVQEAVETLNTEKEKMMRWGIMALGGAVLGMGTWIFNFIFSRIH